MGCDKVMEKLQPVGFQMSGTVFELPASEYVFVSNPNKCFLKIHKNNLPGKEAQIFLMGDLFLKHFYSVYDFDNDKIGLGINSHSKDLVQIYEPGKRPNQKSFTFAEDQTVA